MEENIKSNNKADELRERAEEIKHKLISQLDTPKDAKEGENISQSDEMIIDTLNQLIEQQDREQLINQQPIQNQVQQENAEFNSRQLFVLNILHLNNLSTERRKTCIYHIVQILASAVTILVILFAMFYVFRHTATNELNKNSGNEGLNNQKEQHKNEQKTSQSNNGNQNIQIRTHITAFLIFWIVLQLITILRNLKHIKTLVKQQNDENNQRNAPLNQQQQNNAQQQVQNNAQQENHQDEVQNRGQQNNEQQNNGREQQNAQQQIPQQNANNLMMIQARQELLRTVVTHTTFVLLLFILYIVHFRPQFGDELLNIIQVIHMTREQDAAIEELSGNNQPPKNFFGYINQLYHNFMANYQRILKLEANDPDNNNAVHINKEQDQYQQNKQHNEQKQTNGEDREINEEKEIEEFWQNWGDVDIDDSEGILEQIETKQLINALMKDGNINKLSVRHMHSTLVFLGSLFTSFMFVVLVDATVQVANYKLSMGIV